MMETILKKDSEWSTTYGWPCRVIDFTPSATVKNGKVIASNMTDPYASVVLECKKLPQNTEGFITHKVDFQHLWSAFKERGASRNKEVIIFWNKKLPKGFAKIFSIFMPKLWVMICPKGAFELMSDENFKPELRGEARWNAQKPIMEWKPKI